MTIRWLLFIIVLLHAFSSLAQPDPNAPLPQKPAPPPAPGEPPVIARIDLKHLSAQSAMRIIEGSKDAHCWLPNDSMISQAFTPLLAAIRPEGCIGLKGLNALIVRPSAKTRADAEKAAAIFAAQMKRLDVAGGAGMVEVMLVSLPREQIIRLLTNWAPDGVPELTKDSTDFPEIRRISDIRLMKGTMDEYLTRLPVNERGNMRARDCYVFPLTSSPVIEHSFRDNAARLSFYTMRGIGLDRILLFDTFVYGVKAPTQRCLFIPEKRSILFGVMQGTRKIPPAEYPIIVPFLDNKLEGFHDPLTLVVLTYTSFDATVGKPAQSGTDFHGMRTLPPLY